MEFRVNDCTYRQTARIDAFTQMAIISKISPLLASGFGELAPLLAQMRSEGVGNLATVSLDKLGQIVTPVARELAKMSDSDRKFIIGSLLSSVSRKRDGEVGWSKVWSVEADRSMHDDINNDLTVMLRIALGVFQETFAGFMPAGLSSSTGSSPAATRSIQ
jgi:hypothetical protein